jgi:hypothetical protein
MNLPPWLWVIVIALLAVLVWVVLIAPHVG